jgi:DNA-directed RNA polymerase specialized sigma24 family protein
LNENLLAAAVKHDEILAVDEALTFLAEVDPQAAELVKLHVFAGLSLEDTAKVMDISVRTAHRNWAYARAWLYRRLNSDSNSRVL